MLKLSGYNEDNINKNKSTHRSRERRDARTKLRERTAIDIDEDILRAMMREEQAKFEEMVKQLGLSDWMINEMDMDDDENKDNDEEDEED
jgi:hypothetical protein